MTALKRNRRPTAPGVILKELYLKDRGIRMGEFAEAIDISYKHLSRIVNGHVPLSPDIAMRLSKALRTSTELWLGLQADVDAWDANQAAKKWKPKKVFEAT